MSNNYNISDDCEINILELDPIVEMSSFIEDNKYNNYRIHYTRDIYFKNMEGVIKEYAILNYLKFDKFISSIYNQMETDYNISSNSYEIIPLSKYAEHGLELKEYLNNNGINIENVTSKEILQDNKYYYLVSLNEKKELIRKQQDEMIYIVTVRDECPVCYINKILYKYYECDHTICSGCHIEWLRHLGITCPMCRSD